MKTLQTDINTKEISRFLINVQETNMLPSIFSWKIHHDRLVLLFSLKYEETCIYNT